MERKNIISNFNLTSEEKKQLMEEIHYYFQKERDEELGLIATESIMDFFLNTLGKQIYNKALDDAKIWYTKRMDLVESDFYEIYK